MSADVPSIPEPLGQLAALAELLVRRNDINRQIAAILGRPATPGNVGEFIASRIFDIELAPSGVNPGHDGYFRTGPLAGRSVNVKLYAEDAGLLDIGPHPADYYLVLTGPRPARTVGPRDLPTRIDGVYLFETDALRADLTARGVGVGIASSVRKSLWSAARVYPTALESPLRLDPGQVQLLELFRS